MKIENILGDGIAYVSLLDTMGDEWTPAEDARTSTDKGRLGPEKDSVLQRRLMKDAHTSPFEGVIAKFELCLPLFVVRELDRHRTVSKPGEEDPFDFVSPEEAMRKWFARNEMSGRYIQMPNLYYHPARVRGQSRTNKQGGGQDASDVPPEVAAEFISRGQLITLTARELYNWAVAAGIEKGMARIYNTQNQYTKIRLTGSVKNWLDLLFLREPEWVLWECRQAALGIDELLSQAFPAIVQDWKENVRDGIRLTKSEAQALKDFFETKPGYDRLDVNEDVISLIKKKLGL